MRELQQLSQGKTVLTYLSDRLELPPDSLPDGLYWVRHSYAEGGFVIKFGRIITCAPCLRSRLQYYLSIAVKIADV